MKHSQYTSRGCRRGPSLHSSRRRLQNRIAQVPAKFAVGWYEDTKRYAIKHLVASSHSRRVPSCLAHPSHRRAMRLLQTRQQCGKLQADRLRDFAEVRGGSIVQWHVSGPSFPVSSTTLLRTKNDARNRCGNSCIRFGLLCRYLSVHHSCDVGCVWSVSERKLPEREIVNRYHHQFCFWCTRIPDQIMIMINNPWPPQGSRRFCRRGVVSVPGAYHIELTKLRCAVKFCTTVLRVLRP